MTERTVDAAWQNTRHIYELIDRCVETGACHAVVCPGSRCAPLLIGCEQHPALEVTSMTDERSAAFVAMGMAQQTERPVILVCTSGTAVQNFAPAITEAFYQHTPLFVLSADRPPEWIDQWDGQTIHQQNLYAPHIKGSMNLDNSAASAAEAHRLLQRATTLAAGPVHINIPISKPFYLAPQTRITYQQRHANAPEFSLPENTPNEPFQRLQAQIERSERILIMPGQHAPDPELKRWLTETGVAVLGDIISNLGTLPGEVFFNSDDDAMRPDLLITFGRSLISERQKQYFRQHRPTRHWHIGYGQIGDPLRSLSDILAASPRSFFRHWIEQGWQTRPQSAYRQHLANRRLRAQQHVQQAISGSAFSQFHAIRRILGALPPQSVLHLGNSMPLRCANFIGLSDDSVEVWSNRGTSGIDGCVSSAVGHAIASPDKVHTLLIGDLSFFYDRNGLWLNRKLPDNLDIVIINNHGGGIFRLIPGPANHPSAQPLFTAAHGRNAALSAQEFGLGYQPIHSLAELDDGLGGLWRGKPTIVELFSDEQADADTFQALMKSID